MHITVAGKQVETGEALQTHVRDGLGAIAHKYFDHALEANVTFHRDNRGLLRLRHQPQGRARPVHARPRARAPDAHRAFEEAAEHLAKRLRRYRRRVNDHARSLARGARPTAAPEGPPDRAAPEDEEAPRLPAPDRTAPTTGGVVAEHPAEIARLSVGEAVMRLDLTHAPVLMFRNSGSGALNVVYRRADGHVGWIDAPAG